MPPFARLTFAIGSPVWKWTTSSTSMLVYGWPQRRTGSWIMVFQDHSAWRGFETRWPGQLEFFGSRLLTGTPPSLPRLLFFLLISWSIFGGLSRKPACAKGNAIAFGAVAGPRQGSL